MNQVQVTFQTNYNGWLVEGDVSEELVDTIENELTTLTLKEFDDDSEWSGLLNEDEVKDVVKFYCNKDVVIKYDHVSS